MAKQGRLISFWPEWLILAKGAWFNRRQMVLNSL